MTKTVKIWLIAAALLLIVGILFFVGVMSAVNWDFTKLSTVKYETNEYKIKDKYTSITVVTNTSDVLILPSDGNETRVVCYEEEKLKHSVSVVEDTLSIELNNKRKWYDHIGINLGSPKITVYIPAGEYGALMLKGDTGDAEIAKDFKFSSINAEVSTGDVICYASSSHSVRIKASTGHIMLNGVTAGSLELAVSTGKIEISRAECTGDVKISTSTGKTNIESPPCLL